MAEFATIARPYAEALYKAVGSDNPVALAEQLEAIAQVAGQPEVWSLADNPNITRAKVTELVTGVAAQTLSPKIANLLAAIVDNGRLRVLPEVAAQFRALVNGARGVSDATIVSAYPMDEALLADTVATLEKHFGRKLQAQVQVDASLIGGIRALVGDEVLDTSIKARLDQMRTALIA